MSDLIGKIVLGARGSAAPFGYKVGPTLTKRELFAAMAMQGALASTDDGWSSEQAVAKWSVECADALIAELAK